MCSDDDDDGGGCADDRRRFPLWIIYFHRQTIPYIIFLSSPPSPFCCNSEASHFLLLCIQNCPLLSAQAARAFGLWLSICQGLLPSKAHVGGKHA